MNQSDVLPAAAKRHAGPNLLLLTLVYAGLLLIAVAVACELAALTVLNFKAGYFIPVGRMGSIVWMIGVSLTLPAKIANPVPAE